MQIIISPAKQMKASHDFDLTMSTPLFLAQQEELLHHLQSLSYEQLKEVLQCSQAIAKKTYTLYQNWQNYTALTPAIFAYQGIQYQYMGHQIFTDEQYAFLQEHLFILSGLYSILRPLDGIQPYRLEMQAKCPFSLYTFWNDQLANQLEDPFILNLASEEYSKCIRKYKPLVDVRFFQEENGKLKEKGVYAKMARGLMVRFIAENHIQSREELETFSDLGYQYSKEHSHSHLLTFIQNS